MTVQPSITTERLVLRPFTAADAPLVQKLAGDRAVYATTLRIPHPYPDGEAERWITQQPQEFTAGTDATFAIVEKESDALVGAIGLSISPPHRHAEMGYWIGRPYWNRGYATEAARALLKYGFTSRGLNRIHAHYFAGNAPSGRVLENIGMSREGRLRQHICKDGVFHDLIWCGITRDEYVERSAAP